FLALIPGLSLTCMSSLVMVSLAIGEDTEGVLGDSFLTLAQGILFVLIAAGLGYWARHLALRSLEKRDARAREIARDVASWERAMQRWNNLHYCFRDKCVFILGEDRAVSLDKVDRLLTQPERR
ncbi:MAG: hypothetical protein ACE5JP_17450, partial [Candidatus Bipolaricaulia bacterium]